MTDADAKKLAEAYAEMLATLEMLHEQDIDPETNAAVDAAVAKAKAAIAKAEGKT